MKIRSSLAISFVFLAFLAKPFALGASPEPLLDVDGDEVRPGNSYYIVSAIWGAGGGGLSLIRGKLEICLRDVIQLPSSLEKGLPLYFQPLNDTATDYIYESTNINIVFDSFPEVRLCGGPRVWKVDNFDPFTRQWFITTTGDIRKPGPLTSLNWFKVEKSSGLGGVYKINHCPGSTSDGLCKHVGIYHTHEARRLALSDTPFMFVIIKAESALNKGRIASVV